MNPRPAYRSYSEVPWYRRSSTNSALLLLQLLTLPLFPVAVWVCLVLLTGEVYYGDADASGGLRRWGLGNKIAAVIILVACVAVLVFHPFRRAR
jgi:hypothetical protein